MIKQKIVIISLLALGMIFPFINALVVIEAFFLSIVLIILLFASVALLIGCLVGNRANLKESIPFILAVPLFVGAQFLSTWTVNHIQRTRTEYAIHEIENIISQTGQVPENYPTTLGIKYTRLNALNEFQLSYSRGFMVTEVYYSKEKTWESQGWND